MVFLHKLRIMGGFAFALVLPFVVASELPTIDSAGTTNLRLGNYSAALLEVSKSTTISDSGFYWFRLGQIYHGLGNRSEALHALRLCAEKNPLWKPFAYEAIGTVEEHSGTKGAAIMAYRSALESATTSVQKQLLRAKMLALVKADTALAVQIPWIDTVGKKATLNNDAWAIAVLDTLLRQGDCLRADSILNRFEEKNTRITISLLSLLKKTRISDSCFTTERLLTLAKIAFACRDYSFALQYLTKANRKKNADTLSGNEINLFFAAQLFAKLGDYVRVTALIDRHDRLFGATSASMMLLARSYKKLGKIAQADYWYDKHVLKFPNKQETVDILWLRAWEREADGKYTDAIRIYRTIVKKYSGSTRGDVSQFRIGLCFYKNNNFDSALVAFSKVYKDFPISSFITAAEYWRGKSLVAFSDSASSRKVFSNLVQLYPSSYYSFRAREMLLRLGDTVTPTKIWWDTVTQRTMIGNWLDSASKGIAANLDTNDVTLLRLGASLVLCGLDANGKALLSPLEARFPKSASLSYLLATVYAQGADPTVSYRGGLRLLSRIPSVNRGMLPLGFLHLIYPTPVEWYVKQQTDSLKIPWQLVYAVMRQESMFDADIQSGAGAVGLMQIMPQTGKTIAHELKSDFATDSLFNPFVNIRYGAYYISELLKQFKGNMILAIAAYNGGPENAEAWGKKGASLPPDLFVENIDYTETREYVKKVLGNFWAYSALKSHR